MPSTCIVHWTFVTNVLLYLPLTTNQIRLETQNIAVQWVRCIRSPLDVSLQFHVDYAINRRQYDDCTNGGIHCTNEMFTQKHRPTHWFRVVFFKQMVTGVVVGVAATAVVVVVVLIDSWNWTDTRAKEDCK